MSKLLIILFLLHYSSVLYSQWNDPAGEKKVREVYERLYAASGNAEQAPELQFSKSTLRMAYMSHQIGKRPTITLERKAFEICESYKERSEDMIAVLLGHELMHHFFKHNWGDNFLNVFFTEEFLKSEISSLRSEMKTFETQADESGLKLVYLAGYNPRGIVSDFYKRLYSVYGMAGNDNAIKIAALQDSLDALGQVQKRVDYDVQQLMDYADFAMLSGNNQIAIEVYRVIISNDLRSKEVYNNFAVCFVQEHLKGVSEMDFPYLLPIKRSDGRGIIYLEGWSEISASAIDSANYYFNQALKLDSEYETARMNLACTRFLSSDDFGAQKVINDRLGGNPSAEFKTDAELVLSLIEICRLVKENKKKRNTSKKQIWEGINYDKLENLSKNGHELASLNKEKLMYLSRFEQLHSLFGTGKNGVSQYPSLNTRISITEGQEAKVNELITIIEFANYAMLLGDNLMAIDLFEFALSHGMHSKEIYNNLGLCYTLEYLKSLKPEEFPYFLPLELDITQRSDSTMFSTKGGGSLELAISSFQSALRYDKEYAVAGINLACAHILNEEYLLADNRIREVQFYHKNDQYILNNCELLLAIVEIEKNGRDLELFKQKAGNSKKSKKKKKKTKKGSTIQPADRIEELAQSGHYLAQINFNKLVSIATNTVLRKSELKQVPFHFMELSSANYSYSDSFRCDVLEINQNKKYGVDENQAASKFSIGSSALSLRFFSNCMELAFGRVMLRTINESFLGNTENGIKIGSSRAEVEEKYGTPNSIVAASDGYFLMYNKCQIIFHINRLNQVQKWIIYQKTN